MRSYSVDASVYALPDMARNSGEEINEYLQSLLKLSQLIKREDIRIFLFQKDITFLIDHKMLPDADKINRLRNKITNKNYDPQRVVSGFLRTIREALQSWNYTAENHSKRATRELFFENWFHFRKIETKNTEIETKDFCENAFPEIPPEILCKKMSVIALLNKFVYKDHEKHRLIVNKKLIKNDISAVHLSSIVKGDFNYSISDIPSKEIKLVHEKIGISGLGDIGQQEFPDILSAYETAKKDFVQNAKTFIIGEDVEEGIREYSRILKSQNSNKGYANTLYSHLEALNDFVIQFRQKEQAYKDFNQYQFAGSPDSRSCNSPYCEYFDVCKSFIYLLGVRCSDENQNQLDDNRKVYDERIRGNGRGKKELFRIHLKPHTEPCFSSVFLLTLRIYFKWDREEEKIIIGWLGRHLYLPIKCPPHMTSCWRWDKGCPANSKFN
ncbi:hypothetical protein FACS189450_04400 [Spirochaetia bacterium]|nr:hypothetical protein FACS189450_04400 [Spirochaetia bacterium]